MKKTTLNTKILEQLSALHTSVELCFSISKSGVIEFIPKENFLSLKVKDNIFDKLFLRSTEHYNEIINAFDTKLKVEFNCVFGEGEHLMYLYLSGAVFSDECEKDIMVFLVRNNTEFIKSKKAFDEKFHLFKTVLKTSIDAIIIIDNHGIIIESNPSTEHLFGYTRKELIGHNIKMLMPEKYSMHHDEYLERYKRTNKSKVIGAKRELIGMRKGGILFPIELSLSEMEHCGEAKFTGIINDITEKKNFEKMVLDGARMLKEKNNRLNELNLELSTRSEEIKAQSEELLAQNNLALVQKREIEEQKAEIIDSIVYAQRIQKASLPMQVFLDFIYPKHFVLYEPKDVVSGDFYWAFKKNQYSLFAVGDCTGHGVPGCILTIMGIAYLNEIANLIKDPDPGRMLDMIRVKVIKSLHQTESQNILADGLDIALCVIDESDKTIRFAGANNPAYILRSIKDEDTGTFDPTLFELKGDKMPVSAHHYDDKPFNTKSFQLHEKDMIYVFSDGFRDQIGGPKNQKFNTTQLKKLLQEIFCLPTKDQHNHLKKSFDNWRSYPMPNGQQNYQTDDICIMGVRVLYDKMSVESIMDIDDNWDI